MKKSAIELETLVVAAIVLVVLVVVIAVFVKQFGQGSSTTSTLFDKTNFDCDNDGKKDIVDPCPCAVNKEPENGVCPTELASPKECDKYCEEEYKKRK